MIDDKFLGKRLLFIMKKAGHCEVLADVGTDHAFLPVYAVLNGFAKKAIASDINKGPLERAEAHIKENGLADKISLRLCPGLEGYAPGESDCLVIAGMGGNLIAEVLKNSPEAAASFSEIVLSPNSCENDLRKYLWNNGFEITDEDAVCEGDHAYLTICATYTGKKSEYNREDLYLGKILPMKADSPDVIEYYKAKLRKLRTRSKGLLKALKFDEAEYNEISVLIEKTDKIISSEG